MKKKCAILIINLICRVAFADGIDVYGVNDKLAEKILKKFGTETFNFEKKLMLERTQGTLTVKSISSYREKQNILQERVAKAYGFKQVFFDTVYYPETKEIFTTIEVPSLPISDTKLANYQIKCHDIINDMILFTQKIARLMVTNPDFGKEPQCKDLHCICPESPLVLKDLEHFRALVPKQHALIKKTIESDKSLVRQRAALFLLAFYKNPQEVADILNKVLRDPSFHIRHDALRVYGVLLQKAPWIHTRVDLFIPSCFSMHEAERNKSLIVLNELSKQKKYQKTITSQLNLQLLKLLKLKQPNNHDLAYSILKNTTGQTFSDLAYADWEKYLKKTLT